MTTQHEVWLIRHGRTASNAMRVLQGQTDTPLDDVGRDQAASLATWLSAAGRPTFDTVIASPLSRARQTAEACAQALKLGIEEDARWMERSFGVLEGTPADEAWQHQDAFEGDPFDFRPDGGESANDMAARVVEALVELRARGRVLVVTHGGPVGAAVFHAMDLPYESDRVRRLRRHNTGITVLQPRRVGWAMVTCNATPHLW